MKPDLTLRLGDFEFRDSEVPESIGIGGSQTLAVHKLVGGTKIVDALGPDPEPLSWSGWIVGPDALERVLYLDQLRAQGKELRFTFGPMSYRVTIASFVATFQRLYHMPYKITLEVVEAENLKQGARLSDAVSDILDADANEATGLAALLNDTGITTAVNAVRDAIDTVSDWAQAATAQVSSVLEPIREARALVQAGMDATNQIVSDVTTLGGILPENPVSVNAAEALEQANALVNHSNLSLLDGILARMALNVQNANAAKKSVTVAGGDLYAIAASEYGDPSAWTTIARANGLLDPLIEGVKTLKIPARSDKSGGVLNV